MYTELLNDDFALRVVFENVCAELELGVTAFDWSRREKLALMLGIAHEGERDTAIIQRKALDVMLKRYL